MLIRKRRYWLLVCWILLYSSFQSTQLAMPDVAGKGDKKALKLVTEYKHNILEELSSDGRLMLFYQTSTPMRTYTYRSDTGKVKPDQPEVYDDVLRVVKLDSGSELGRIGTNFFPANVQFVPGINRVFYAEPRGNRQRGWLFKLWDWASGKALACSNEDATGFISVVFLDKEYALATVRDEGDSLVKLTLGECTLRVMGPVHPTYLRGRAWSKLAVSPNKRFLAYTIYVSHEAIIWDINSKQVIKTLNVAPLYVGDKIVYSPDGKLLLIDAANKPFGGPDYQRYLLFYDIKTYQLMRRLEVPDISAIAISPDSKTLAVAYRKEERKTLSTDEQGFIVLYDLATGEELATASHPAVKRQRNDPGVSKITRLAFTPDGKYLLSSTYDTRVWRID